MKHCEKCNVDVAGDRKICPLCQTVLSGEGEENAYPYIHTFYSKYRMLIKTGIFASICACIISFAVNSLIPQSGKWSSFVLFGMACIWLCLYIIIKKGENIPKTIFYHVFIVSGLSVLWDKFTGWHGWSVDFVIPSVCMVAMIATVVLVKALKGHLRNYLFFIFMNAIFGILPIILYYAGFVKIPHASVICTALSVIIIFALLIFQGHEIIVELKKKFHL